MGLEHLIPFTSETAKEMQLRSAQSRSARIRQSQPTLTPASSYVLKRLARVRKQINLLSTKLEAELAKAKPDAQAIDRFCSALSRLGEQERQYANRPLPGSWKPQAPRQDRRATRPEPVIDIQPVPPEPGQQDKPSS